MIRLFFTNVALIICVAIAPLAWGVERKLNHHHSKALFRVGGGYDWHFGNYSVGPLVSLDAIEGGEQVYYIAISGGYSF